jgi:diaminopimelate epimerase
MPYHLKFTKVTGAGNDFVLINDMDRSLPLDPSALARLLCSRNFGVGADGILVVLPSTKADFTMGYWNADGSTGGMCGNGGRCIARYAYDRGIAGAEMRFEAFGHIYRAAVTPLGIRLQMRVPAGFRRGIPLTRGSEVFAADYVNTGSPHAVVFVPDLEGIDVVGLGRWMRHHQEFAPEGVNANFVQVVDADTIRLRTYERGVEAETMACGTGSVASALIHRLRVAGSGAVSVQVRSGARLLVHMEGPAESSAPELEGEAFNVFDGSALVSDDSMRIWAYIEGGAPRE